MKSTWICQTKGMSTKKGTKTKLFHNVNNYEIFLNFSCGVKNVKNVKKCKS
jgi:hypothetical protein